MLFGSISGSAAAAVSSIGGFMIPEMNAKGYDRRFNVAVTTTAATTGLMIPPSNVMIVYSVAAGSVSLGGHILNEGDGAELSEEARLEIEGIEAAEVVLFDLA